MVEVYKESEGSPLSGWLGEASAHYYKHHQLSDLQCARPAEYFEVTRYVVRYSWPGAEDYPSPAKLYRILEHLYQDRRYVFTDETLVRDVDSQIVEPLERR